MKDKTYDFCKKLFSTLPLVATFVISIGKIWGFEWAEAVAGTIAAVATLGLGWLQIQSNKFFTDHDIVEMGHITFLNPELHENEEEEQEPWQL